MPRVSPQPGPQTTFSASPADIAIYGGSAGGGKTWSLAYEAARYVNKPGYNAVIFRRTSPELTGGGSIWEEAQRFYRLLGGVPRESPQLDWRFPKTGAKVEFRHLQYETSAHAHQSKQYAFLGFDELTHFEPAQFWYLLSRLRGAPGIPKRMRGTCNPDPDSFVRQLVSWWIGEDGFAIDARSGVLRWFVRLDEQLLWGDSPDAVVAQDPHRIRPRGTPPTQQDTRPEPMSMTFVRARATDNLILMQQDPGYIARLSMIPGAQQRRLRDGDWNARDVPGDYFDRSWCPIVDRVDERTVVRRVRCWDKAATSPSAHNPDPDWTRGVRVALLNTGQYVIEDLASLRAGPPEVERLIRQTAEADGQRCEVCTWQDPGQAGVVDVDHMRTLLTGFAFTARRAALDKIAYARIWSPMAHAGRVLLLQREYLGELCAELEGFPLRRHDDIVDALSGAMLALFEGAVEFAYDGAPDDRHPGPPRDAWDELEDDELRSGGAARGVCF